MVGHSYLSYMFLVTSPFNSDCCHYVTLTSDLIRDQISKILIKAPSVEYSFHI